VDLPRSFTIRESSHRIHNPFTSDKLATLGQALSPQPGTRMLDLACGTGEMLCTWARDHQVTGTGIDIGTAFIAAARARAVELGVDDQVRFVHGEASGYVASEPVGIASCVGATWIGRGVAGTVDLLRQSLRPGGVMLIGEPYWRREPPDQATVEGCYTASKDDFLPLPDLIERFGSLGCDVVEMVLASQDSWDRYAAAQWLNIRRWLDRNPDDELAGQMRAELTTSPARYARYSREYLGWGVFALMNRFDSVAGFSKLSSFGEAAAAAAS
jgi:SAM-dependent methyltransferase